MKVCKWVAAAILVGASMTAHAGGAYGALGFGSASNWGTGLSVAFGASDVARLPLDKKSIPIAVEAGYVDLGSRGYWGWSASASALYGAAVASFPLQNKLSANVKLGLTSVTADACVPGVGCASGHSTGLMFGAGVQYDLGGALSIGADYRSFDSESILGGNVTMKF